MKILIVRLTSFGHIILTTPIIRILKSQDWTIHYATHKKHMGLIEANPYIDKIHMLNESDSELHKELKNENFDVIIDLENTRRSEKLTAGRGRQRFTFGNFSFKKWLFVNLKINRLPNIHLVDHYLQSIDLPGIKNDNLGLDYFIPEKDEIENDWLPASFQNGFAVFVVGADFKTRQLPVKRMIELCDRINKPIVLIGGKKEVSIGNEIEEFFRKGSDEMEKEIEPLNKKTIIFNACSKFSINQSASIISKASWVFTHDTDMMHVAAAFKKPIYTIWGNTVPAFGTYPYRTQFTVFENNKIDCRPCTVNGFEKCPKKHFKCMKDLTFDFYLPD